eukprot:gene28378-34421_t
MGRGGGYRKQVSLPQFCQFAAITSDADAPQRIDLRHGPRTTLRAVVLGRAESDNHPTRSAPALASADAPMVLPNHITDTSGVLDSGQRSDIQAAIDQLGEDHQIDLWVAFVPDFNNLGGQAWAQQTATKSTLSTKSVLLAVATAERAYYLDVPAELSNITDSDIESINTDAVEPALAEDDWTGAAIAAAGALGDANNTSGGMGVGTLLIAGGAVVVGTGGVVLYSRKRKNDKNRK